MLRMPTLRVSAVRRTFPIAVVTAFLTVALLGMLIPSAAAAPAAPYFGPSVLVDALPSYTGYAPSIAVGSDGFVYAAYAGWGGTTTGDDIFFAKSSNGGRTWTTSVRVNDFGGAGTQQDPSLAVDHTNTIYIVWTDNRVAGNDIYFAKSTDGGVSFSANVRVNDITMNGQTQADVAVDSAG